MKDSKRKTSKKEICILLIKLFIGIFLCSLGILLWIKYQMVGGLIFIPFGIACILSVLQFICEKIESKINLGGNHDLY